MVSGSTLSRSVIVPFHRNLSQLAQCLRAIREAAVDAELVVAADGTQEDYRPVADRYGARVVVTSVVPQGPAVARNRAAAVATGEILVFVDTDVVVQQDSLLRLTEVLAADRSVAAVFGAYDRAPAERGFISQFKNLSHTYYHEIGREEAQTFWAGLGAVRACVFAEVGGFDERFAKPSVEDIDLGYRIRAAGHRIRLDPSVRGKHLKRWTLWGCVLTDIRARGVPWTQLLLRYGALTNDLNTSRALRASVAVAYLAVGAVGLSVRNPSWLVVAAVLIGSLVFLSLGYYRWLTTVRGVGFAARVVPVHLIHHLCNGLSFGLGTALSIAGRAGMRLPGTLPTDAWTADSARVQSNGRR